MFKVNGRGKPTDLQAGDEVVFQARKHDTRVGFNRPGTGQLLPDRHARTADLTSLTFSQVNLLDAIHVAEALLEALTGLKLRYDHKEQTNPSSDVRHFYVLEKRED